MKKLLLGICLLWMTLSYGQAEFVIAEDGLSPKTISAEMSAFNSSQMYTKTMGWIEENSETYNLSVEHAVENASIRISFLKGNAATLDKQYYNIGYKAKIRFEDGKYTFEPTEIRLKLNSKYDMGWTDFDLYDASAYFKKGKTLRKYKSYLENIPKPMNELQVNLLSYLKSEDN
ncbi:hypothetical protein [Flagellimonas sp.]|uniref:hypothetical protein n=1 Tax=Flagellimonas sp. TaxID=2058762 RepID=UPI003F4A2547